MLFLPMYSQFPIGPGWCYIHRDGVEQCQRGGLLHFREYEGRLPPGPGYHASSQKLLELCMTVSLHCRTMMYVVELWNIFGPFIIGS